MNKIIARLTKKANNLTEEQEKFIQECEESGKFDEAQMYEIFEGFFVNRLPMEQVKIYADTKFDSKQMKEIREGFKNKLTIEQVKLYANPNFDDNQMYEIREGFENGLTMEQVKLYANPNFDDFQMYHIRDSFEDGLTIEEIKSKYRLASRKNKLNRIARRIK